MLTKIMPKHHTVVISLDHTCSLATDHQLRSWKLFCLVPVVDGAYNKYLSGWSIGHGCVYVLSLPF